MVVPHNLFNKIFFHTEFPKHTTPTSDPCIFCPM